MCADGKESYRDPKPTKELWEKSPMNKEKKKQSGGMATACKIITERTETEIEQWKKKRESKEMEFIEDVMR